MQFTVMVADNYRYMDESSSYELGSFATLEEALAVSRRIVDDYLASAHRAGMPAKDLFENYMMFGKDPYVVSSAVEGVPFSARDYAKARCEELCSGPSGPSPERAR